MTKHIPTRQVVIDTETTGLDVASGHRVIEIAAVELLDRRVSGMHFHSYVNPERSVDLGFQAVHGISDELLHDKPTFADLAEEFTDFIRGAELIAHNAAFDVGFINNELSLLRLDPIENICSAVIDSLTIAREQRPEQSNNLSTLCTAYGIKASRKNLHGALLDAYLLAEVYLALTRRTFH